MPKHSETFDLPLPGRDPSAIRLRSDTSDLWAFRMNRPDGTVPGRAWTNEVVLGHLPGKPPQFSVRQLVATDEPELSVTPAVPRFIRNVADKCGLMAGKQRAVTTPTEYRTREEAAALIDHLLDPDRLLPTFVFTTADGVSRGSVDPSVLNSSMLGLAHVAVAHADACWLLTDQLGKRLSVFGGAARIYLPGFSEDADPYTHRLVLANQLETVEDAERVMRWMRQLAAGESIRRTKLGREVLPYAEIKSASLKLRQQTLRNEDASDSDQLTAANERIAELESQLISLASEQEYYIDEYEKERERADVAETQSQKAAWRIQQLTDLLQTNGGDPDSGSVLPSAWADFADWCDQQLAGRLVLTPVARRGVRKPDFNNVETAARSLLWLATEGRNRFMGGGGSLSNITILDGIQNAPCGTDVYDFDWNG